MSSPSIPSRGGWGAALPIRSRDLRIPLGSGRVPCLGPAPSGTRAAGGFTLLEVMVALAIVGIAIVSLIELSSQSLRLVKTSGDYQGAVVLADRLATESQPSDETVDSGEEGPFRWERQVTLVALPEELQLKETVPGREAAKLFAVTIDVRWGRDQVLELATLRTPTTTPATGASPPQSTSPDVQTRPSPTPGQSSTPALRQSGAAPFTGARSR
jgi:general secretion pathway protein I